MQTPSYLFFLSLCLYKNPKGEKADCNQSNHWQSCINSLIKHDCHFAEWWKQQVISEKAEVHYLIVKIAKAIIGNHWQSLTIFDNHGYQKIYFSFDPLNRWLSCCLVMKIRGIFKKYLNSSSDSKSEDSNHRRSLQSAFSPLGLSLSQVASLFLPSKCIKSRKLFE